MCSKRLIDNLFRNGSSFFIYPYRVTYLHVEEPATKVQVLFSVPKRRFRLSVQRNRIKRRMREAYRLQKYEFIQQMTQTSGSGLAVAVQYVGNADCDYHVMHERMAEVLKKLLEAYNT